MPSSYLFLNGLRLHYLHWNLDGSGPAVVLLHDLSANARLWEPAAAELAASGFTVLAPDLRGHGLTDGPVGDYGFEVYAADLAAFIAAADLSRPVLAGHGWGGLLALDYASRAAFGPRAPAGIVLADGGMIQWDETGWEEARRRLAPPGAGEIPLSAFLERLDQGQSSWLPDEEAVPRLLASYCMDEDETLTPRLSPEIRLQIARAIWEYPTHAAFRRLRCPALALPAAPAAGAQPHDPLVWELNLRGVDRLAREMKAGRVVWLTRASPHLLLEQPAVLAGRILEFARSLPVHV